MHGRLVLEQVAAGPDMVSEIVKVFEINPRCGSSIFLFAQGTSTWSDPDTNQMAVVIEHDYGLASHAIDYEGVTARLPSHNPLHGNPLAEGVLTKWAVPEHYVFVEELPRTSVGKVDKKSLRSQHGVEG